MTDPESEWHEEFNETDHPRRYSDEAALSSCNEDCPTRSLTFTSFSISNNPRVGVLDEMSGIKEAKHVTWLDQVTSQGDRTKFFYQ